MKKLEIIFGSLLVISFILRLMLIPGGTFLSVVILSLLSLLYLIFSFIIFNPVKSDNLLKQESYSNIGRFKIINSVVFGLGLSILCIGILYKLQGWPGPNNTITIGLSLIMISSLFAFVKHLKSKDSYFSGLLIRVFIFGLLGVVFMSVSSIDIFRFEYRNHPEYIQAFENYLSDPNNETLREKMEYEYKRTYMSEEEIEFYLEFEKDENQFYNP